MPLEKRYDFLNLASGKKIQVPFDQLIVFSTNLEPKQLVDDAFLRRIPYKIEVIDPNEAAFRQLFKIMAPKLGVEYDEAAVDYLIETHYRAVNRPFRCCQPRDLILQIRNYCRYTNKPAKMTPENFDFAVRELLRGDVGKSGLLMSLMRVKRHCIILLLAAISEPYRTLWISLTRATARSRSSAAAAGRACGGPSALRT